MQLDCERGGDDSVVPSLSASLYLTDEEPYGSTPWTLSDGWSHALSSSFSSPCILVARSARAQVHWDIGGEAGVMKRFTTGSDVAAPNPGFGPAFELQGHVAVLPMLRVGLYLAQDISPASAIGVRTFWEGGLHAKVTPPLLPSPWKTYAFLGFGYAFTHADGYTGSLGAAPPGSGGANVSVAYGPLSGGMLDVPVGIGLSRRLGGAWNVFAELGARVGVAFFGSMYNSATGATATVPNLPPVVAPYLGQDSFALSLSVGLSLDR